MPTHLKELMASRIALVVGATGVVGLNLTEHLAAESGWKVFGLARNPSDSEGVQAVAADLLKPDTLSGALKGIEPTHVFLTTWLRQPTEAENIKINATMVRNLLQALSNIGSVQHVALVTGLKHYLGPSRATARESCQPPRSAKTRAGWKLIISTMRRRTRSSLRPSETALHGVCIVRTPLSATR